MITQILQNLVRPSHLVHSQLGDASLLSHRGEEGLLRAAISGIKERLVEALRQQSKETEIRKATQYLHGLTDEQLLDMGITRLDIAHVVRHGKV
jgi:uncharacterized protein YjiS (DUF1127 family)